LPAAPLTARAARSAKLGAVVEPEFKLREAVQVCLATVLVGSVHSALENGEDVLNRLGVDREADIVAMSAHQLHPDRTLTDMPH
jgi:hypothetical protein